MSIIIGIPPKHKYINYTFIHFIFFPLFTQTQTFIGFTFWIVHLTAKEQTHKLIHVFPVLALNASQWLNDYKVRAKWIRTLKNTKLKIILAAFCSSKPSIMAKLDGNVFKEEMFWTYKRNKRSSVISWNEIVISM